MVNRPMKRPRQTHVLIGPVLFSPRPSLTFLAGALLPVATNYPAD